MDTYIVQLLLLIEQLKGYIVSSDKTYITHGYIKVCVLGVFALVLDNHVMHDYAC
jgi:hypothetical protein